MISRRNFLRGLLGTAAIASAPKFIFDMGANLYKQGSWVDEYYQRYLEGARLQIEAHILAHEKYMSGLIYNDGTGMIGEVVGKYQANPYAILEVNPKAILMCKWTD